MWNSIAWFWSPWKKTSLSCKLFSVQPSIGRIFKVFILKLLSKSCLINIHYKLYRTTAVILGKEKFSGGSGKKFPSHCWEMTYFPCFNLYVFIWKLKRHAYGWKTEPPEQSMKCKVLTQPAASSFLLAASAGCRRWKLVSLTCCLQGPPEEKSAGKNENRATISFQKAASCRWCRQFIC